MEYEAVIGLETHVQLKTKSKMWCGCANEFGAAPNTNVCPVCLGLPGVLPVANEEGLRQTALAGLLLNCEVSRYAKFDRKNYFYPDAPKNYQITQFDKPSTPDFGHCAEIWNQPFASEPGGGTPLFPPKRARSRENRPGPASRSRRFAPCAIRARPMMMRVSTRWSMR